MWEIMSKVNLAAVSEPIYSKGNWFWSGEERFLIKGVSYIPRITGGDSYGTESKVDPLDDSRLEELRRDIVIFQELGLNTIQVSALRPDKQHGKAMNLLAHAGIYVLVTFLEDFKLPDQTTEAGPNLDTTICYTADLLTPVLKVVDELAEYPNLLGFVVGADAINRREVSKLSEVYRATVRDMKTWLRERGGRLPPVGVSINDIAILKRNMLEYFTAGPIHERADFFAMDSWGWCFKSSFKVSGWKNMVEAYERYPVPMYLSAFGAFAGRKRLWEEIACLYSPEMTGLFSGGCAYTYFEYGNRYGLVKARQHEVQKKGEYGRLKEQFADVNQRAKGEVFTAQCKDYEGWEGVFPVIDEWWHAKPGLPQIEQGLEGLMQELRDEKEWDLVDADEIAEDDDGAGEAVDQLSKNVEEMAISKRS